MKHDWYFCKTYHLRTCIDACIGRMRSRKFKKCNTCIKASAMLAKLLVDRGVSLIPLMPHDHYFYEYLKSED